MVSRRVLLRGRPAGPQLRRWAAGAGLLTTLAAGWLAVSPTPLALAALFVAALGLVVTVLLMRFVATIAASVVGIGIGVAALFTVLAVTSGFETELLQRMGRLNGHVLVTKYGIDFFEWEATAAQLRAHPEVRAASPFVFGAVSVNPVERGDDEEMWTSTGDPAVIALKGLDPKAYADVEGAPQLFASGTLDGIRPGHLHLRPPGIVVGERLARRLRVAVGDHLRVVAASEVDGSDDAFLGDPRSATFEVSDIFSTGVGDVDDTIAVVDIRAAMSLLYGEGRATGIELDLREPKTAEDLAPALAEQLNVGHVPPLFRTMASARGATPIVVMRNIRRIVSFILSLIVLVAGSTLIGALLLIVRQRRRQIAVLSTLGATRWRLFWIFETAGVLSGLLGAAVGLVLGVSICWGLASVAWPLDPEVYPLARLPVEPQWLDGVVPAAVAVLVCALVSGPVALHAARARPIDALRA